MPKPPEKSAIVWFRSDLRLADNPALAAAIATGLPLIPVFIWAPEEEAPWPPGSASQWWLHQSLTRLQNDLKKLGSTLIIRRGPTADTLFSIAAESNAQSVFWNRRYEPAIIARDSDLKVRIQEKGIIAESFNGSLLFEPWTIRNSAGKPFQVFTSFYKACLASTPPSEPIEAPSQLMSLKTYSKSVSVDELALEPKIDWAGGIREGWNPGEEGAIAMLNAFARESLRPYADERNRPDHVGTSRLSPHLHFGEISPRQIWHTLSSLPKSDTYLRQLIWREFAFYLLYHYPSTPAHSFRPEFNHFPWYFDAKKLKAWTRGLTGYPLVDAGMRQLWHTGWMHNRVRMVTASFLVKHLLIAWQEGAAWFWDTLVDADLANNTMGWQWVAGCGCDPAPYFRIFNPVLQGEKFDPEGNYVRRWIPELVGMSAKYIHSPWAAPLSVLSEAGVKLGKTYPLPIVDHAKARAEALAAFAELRSHKSRS
jgi:deoxyribodipyrimidine photo-lyase